ncbi:MAG: hypothetical protein QM572_02440 [Nocardioides sp.]|uniref:hypothetical protein n=1 Tax=Nocardioides sp. TaxID=35761 RepID=UPI0039E6A148
MTVTERPVLAASADATLRTDFMFLRIGLGAVGAYCLLGLGGFAVFAGFWPPPAEKLDPAGIYGYFLDHEVRLRIGMVMMAACGPFYFVWSAVLSKIIGRIEGPLGILSTVELLGGLLTGLVTFVPPVIWITAAFRIEHRSPETVSTFYDFGWMFFDLTFVCSVLQSVALGIAILRDRREVPLFPAWVAWVAFLTSATYVPLTCMPFFRSGPFAWNGLICFWAVFVMFFVLIVVVTPYAFKAVGRIEAEVRAGADA